MGDNKHTIEVGNKLIAEFMELSTSVLHGDLCYADWDGVHSVKYHESWDWLMPVVIRINKNNKMVCISFWTDQNTTECKIYNWELGADEQEAECENPIEAVWQAVVLHIQHYNSTQSK